MNPWAAPLERRRRYTVAPRTWVPGELVTAGMMNSIRDNLNEVGTKVDTGGVTIVGALAQDMVLMSSPNQLGYVRPVASKFPRFNGTNWEMASPGAGQHDAFISAAGMLPTVGAGVPCGYHETVSNGYGNFIALPFSGTATQQASFTMQLPRSWDPAASQLHIQLFVFNKNGQGGNAYWTTYFGDIPHWTTINWTPGNGAAKVEPVPGGANYIQYVDMGWQWSGNVPYPATAGQLLNFLVQRVAADAQDTHNDTLYLVGARVIITTNNGVDG